jgi:GDP/UDP-N,N'-diacetylbacillosamine 2-epimerase (hydrolysing)
MRRICYITGTRADYGLMHKVLNLLHADSEINLRIIATGMHLLSEYGNTVEQIREDGFAITAEVPVYLSGSSGASMAVALGESIVGIAKALEKDSPDIVLVLGDRGEALSGALAGAHLNIPVVHVHGGERSGTIDESLRHAISKISHYHFVATDEAKIRLCKMGEHPEQIHHTGAPGLDAIVHTPMQGREEVCAAYNIDSSKSYVVLVFHPVLQEQHIAGEQAQQILRAIEESQTQCLVLLPNSDAGGNDIRKTIEDFQSSNLLIHTHIPRNDFLSLVHHSEAIVGNSSCGIIESASLSTPCINIGTRQSLRSRNTNVVDVPCCTEDILIALQATKTMQDEQWSNVYGDGKASERIADLLRTISLNTNIIEKNNAY